MCAADWNNFITTITDNIWFYIQSAAITGIHRRQPTLTIKQKIRLICKPVYLVLRYSVGTWSSTMLLIFVVNLNKRQCTLETCSANRLKDIFTSSNQECTNQAAGQFLEFIIRGIV